LAAGWTDDSNVDPDSPRSRPRLPWWLPVALLAPVLAFVGLIGLGDDAPVDLYTDDLSEASVDAVPAVATTESTVETGSPTATGAAPSDAGEDTSSSTEFAAADDATTPSSPGTAVDAPTSAVAGGGVTSTPTTAPASATPSGATPDESSAPVVSTPGVDGVVASPDGTGTAGDEADVWCEIEVRSDDGVIRWADAGRTAVFRKNDAWYHTPDEAAVAILIPEEVDTGDEYILRLWNGGTDDVPCTFVAAATEIAAPATTAPAPTTTTSTTTTVPEGLAFTELPDPIAIPGGPVQMGFNVDLWGADRTTYWNDLEATPGNGRLIAHEFKSFTKNLNMPVYEWHMNEGRDLLLTWNGTTASSILDGTHDAWIRHHAQELKTLPGTVKLRFWHEPDVSYKANWIEGDPQNYIDAWMYVRGIFVEEGAVDNIEWVWCPTAWNWEQQGALFYPGDDNVDWICADGYSGMNLNKPLDPIADEFTAFQAWADQHPSKPILIAEFGATERDPGDRAAWVQGIPGWVNASPNIRAVVYFDYDKRSEQPWDWRLRTEADAWQAMLDVLGAAPFGN
jgi:hypothetical protein